MDRKIKRRERTRIRAAVPSLIRVDLERFSLRVLK